MNRNIALKLLVAGAVSQLANSTYAEVHYSLNIVPNNFSDLSQGGSWQMVAKTDTVNSDGIVGLVSKFTLGTIPATGTVNPDIGHDIFGGNLVITEFIGLGEIEFLYAQDPNGSIPGLVHGVGLPGGPSDLGADFLGDSFWDNSSEIAFGTIPDLTTLPDLLEVAANETFESIGGGIEMADIGQTVVRIAIPEPTSAALMILACPALLRRRRGQRLI